LRVAAVMEKFLSRGGISERMIIDRGNSAEVEKEKGAVTPCRLNIASET